MASGGFSFRRLIAGAWRFAAGLAGIVVGVLAVMRILRGAQATAKTSPSTQPDIAEGKASPEAGDGEDKESTRNGAGVQARSAIAGDNELGRGELNRDGADAHALSTRRKFLTGASVALGGVGAMLVGVPVVGFLLTPLVREQEDIWRSVGDVGALPVGETVKVTIRDKEALPWAGFAAETAAWLRRESPTNFVAFSVYCTHTGCPVRWLEEAGLFICPCHGGVFQRDGTVAGGPPKEPLARYPVRVRENQVEIRTSPIPVVGTERVD